MTPKRRSIINVPINGNQIYFLAFVILFLPTFLLDTTFAGVIGEHWLRLLSYVSLPLLLMKIYVMDKWKLHQLLIISFFILLGAINWRTAHNVDLLVLVPFIVGARNVPFRHIMSWYFYLGSTLLLLMAFFSLIKVIPNLIYRYGTRPARFSLGMIFPSTIAAHFLFLALAYCYLKFGKLSWLDYSVIVVGGSVCMILTNTRLDFLATIMIVPVMFIAQRAFRGNLWSRIFVSFWWIAIPILSVTTVVSSFFYNSNNHIMRHLDSMSSGRLSLGERAFHRFDIKLLGQTIKEHSYAGVKGHQFANSVGALGSRYFYIDSSYIRMILLWGLLEFMLIVVVISFITIRSTLRKTYILSAIFLIASLNYMFEPHIIQIVYSPFIVSLLSTPYFVNVQEEQINAK